MEQALAVMDTVISIRDTGAKMERVRFGAVMELFTVMLIMLKSVIPVAIVYFYQECPSRYWWIRSGM